MLVFSGGRKNQAGGAGIIPRLFEIAVGISDGPPASRSDSEDPLALRELVEDFYPIKSGTCLLVSLCERRCC